MTARGTILVAIAGLAAAALLAACGESSPEASPTTAGSGTSAGTSAAPATSAAAAGAASAPCTLLSMAEVTNLLGAAPAEPKERGYGAGFAECIWEGDGRAMVRLSVVPVKNLETDFINQLNKLGPVTGLGEGAMAFPGIAGIGFGSGGGASVGFVAGDQGVVLGVRTGDGKDQQGDLATATATAKAVRARLA